jgi:hypothetical protein
LSTCLSVKEEKKERELPGSGSNGGGGSQEERRGRLLLMEREGGFRQRACGQGKRTTSCRWYSGCGVVDLLVTGGEKIGFFLLGRVTAVIIKVPACLLTLPAEEEKNGIFSVE